MKRRPSARAAALRRPVQRVHAARRPRAMAFALNRATLARPLRAAAPKRTPARVPARPVRAGSGDLDRVAAIEDEISRQRAQIAEQRSSIARQREALETVQTCASRRAAFRARHCVFGRAATRRAHARRVAAALGGPACPNTAFGQRLRGA